MIQFPFSFSARAHEPGPRGGFHHSLQKKKIDSVSEKDENLFPTREPPD
jgi:hypothetical protein